MIFKVTELLTVEQQLAKDYLRRKTSIAINNISTAKLIPEFSKEVETELQSKNCIQQFTEILVPVAKKNLHVNSAETEKAGEFDEKLDKDHMAELRKVVDRLSKDEANKDKVIHDHPDIISAKGKARSCWSFGTINCYIKKCICKELKIKKRYKGLCNRKRRTFGNNKYYAQPAKGKKPKQSKPEANESTTCISTPNVPSNDECGSYGGYNSTPVEKVNKDQFLYGFNVHKLGATAPSEDEYSEYREAFEEFACKCAGEAFELTSFPSETVIFPFLGKSPSLLIVITSVLISSPVWTW